MRPDVLAAYGAGEERSPEERSLLRRYARAILRGMENSFYQYRMGLYAPDEYEGEQLTLNVLLDDPVFREFWSRSRSEFAQEYQALVDSLIAAD